MKWLLKAIEKETGLVTEFQDVNEASSALDIPIGNINKVLRGQRKSANGYEFIELSGESKDVSLVVPEERPATVSGFFDVSTPVGKVGSLIESQSLELFKFNDKGDKLLPKVAPFADAIANVLDMYALPKLSSPYEYDEELGLWVGHPEYGEKDLVDAVANKMNSERYFKDLYYQDYPLTYKQWADVEKAVVRRLKGMGAELVEKLDKVNPNYLAFSNGLYNLEKDELTELTRESFQTVQMDYPIIKDGDYTPIENWLKYLMNEEDYIGLCQLIGSLFYRSNEQTQVLAFLIDDGVTSSGKNGKSRVLNFIEELTSTTTLGNLTSTVKTFDLANPNDRFSKSALQHKLVNIDADLDKGKLDGTGELKKLSGGDTIRIEFKNKNSFNYTNYAKFIFSANKLPRFDDESDGWLSRLMIIPFIRDLEKPENRPFLDKSNAEKELRESPEVKGAFVYHCIREYMKVYKTGKRMPFSQSEVARNIKNNYKNDNDPIMGVIEEMPLIEYTGDMNDVILMKDFTVMFDWLKRHNLTWKKSTANIKKMLQEKGMYITKTDGVKGSETNTLTKNKYQFTGVRGVRFISADKMNDLPKTIVDGIKSELDVTAYRNTFDTLESGYEDDFKSLAETEN